MAQPAYSSSTIAEMTEAVQKRIREEDKRLGTPVLTRSGISSAIILEALDQNEIGDAWLFKLLQKDRYCFDHAARRWFRWSDHFWVQDYLSEVIPAVDCVVAEYAKEVPRQAAIRVEATRRKDNMAAQDAQMLENRLIGRIRDLGTLSRRRNVVTIAQCGETSLGISGEEWDRDPYFLGCANGVIDLKTGTLRAGLPRDYIQKASPTAWAGLETPSPSWEAFLRGVFDADENMLGYLRRLFGYAISGLCSEHILPVLWGEGRNGKGTLLETIAAVLGPVAGPVPAGMLLNQARMQSSAAPSPDIMALRGRRFAWASETNEDRFLDIGRVKWLVGGDTLTGRPLYGTRMVEFQPTHTLFLLTNHKPHVSADEFAMWQRLHLIPFQYRFVDEPTEPHQKLRDKDMKDKLLAEAPGILAWLVRGFLEWQEVGLNPPDSVRQATEEYRAEEDLLGHFLDDCCQIRSDRSVRAGVLYQGFKKWCLDNGHRPVSNTKFGRRMAKRFRREDDKDGRYYQGISIDSRYTMEIGISDVSF